MFYIWGISLLVFDNSLYQNPTQKSLHKNTTDIVKDKIEQMEANTDNWGSVGLFLNFDSHFN